MENKRLINSEKLGYENSKIIIIGNKCCILYNFLIVIIFILQIFITTYLLLLGKFAQELDLFNFNKTETDDYITKFLELHMWRV